MRKFDLPWAGMLALFLGWGVFGFWLYLGTDVNPWLKHAIFVVGVIVVEGSFVGAVADRRNRNVPPKAE